VRLLSILFLILSGYFINAQVTLQPKQSETKKLGVVYNSEFAINGYLHTKGWGFGVIFGEIKTYYKTSFYHLDFSTIKHPKEHRPTDQINQFNILSRPYIYAKENSFYAIRGGIGEKRYFSEKAKRRGLAVGVSYQFGASIGVLKPYYLDIRIDETGNNLTESQKYSEENRDKFLNPRYVDGSSGFFKGFNELDFALGVHVKGGAHLAWGAYDKKVKALEIGLMLDLFFQDIPIMIEERNRPYFLNLYLNLQFGKRK
jgi:hypothetical protein